MDLASVLEEVNKNPRRGMANAIFPKHGNISYDKNHYIQIGHLVIQLLKMLLYISEGKTKP